LWSRVDTTKPGEDQIFNYSGREGIETKGIKGKPKADCSELIYILLIY
jgi:hypothetical protein